MCFKVWEGQIISKLALSTKIKARIIVEDDNVER